MVVVCCLVWRTAALAAGLSWSALAAQQAPLRDLDAPGELRTPRAGEGVVATVFGSRLEIPPRDRRHTVAWEAALLSTDAEDGTMPLGSLYLWDHPDDGHLLRVVAMALFDDVLYARTSPDGSEWIATFENYNLPWAQREWVDGALQRREELYWGYARLGLGAGYRTRVAPGEQDNMFATDLLLEPGVLWFGRGDETDPAFVLPESTFELRLRWQTRYDALIRNLVGLPHSGVAAGADVTWGWRADQGAWGLPGSMDGPLENGDYTAASAYCFGVTEVPFLASEQHRLTASLHAGVGDELDRFSAPRVGGGPDLRGEEFGTTARPLLPGAGYGEFFPEHYAIAAAGYRCELTFFAFLDVGGTFAWLDRDRLRGAAPVREDDTMTALSARLTSGFFGETRLQLGYAYGFDVLRDGERGGGEFVLRMSGRF